MTGPARSEGMALDLIHSAEPGSAQGEPYSLETRAADYARMTRALGWLADNWRERPSLEEAADLVGLSPFHFQRIFTRWAGVSPKTFVASLAHAEARSLLEEGLPVLDAAYEAGLSGPSRLHDLFIAQEAVTPGEARKRGEGLTLTFGWAPTPFGRGLFVMAPRGLAGLAFADEGGEETAFADMHGRFPAATWVRDDKQAAAMGDHVFLGGDSPVPVVLIGPPFHVQVWKALLRIPAGATATYADVAAWAGKPRAYQATGAAIGANPVSFLIPCHRAIARNGALTGYHWGLPRKAAMLGLEAVAASKAA